MTFRPLARTLADSLAAMTPAPRTAKRHNALQATLDRAADRRENLLLIERESIRAAIGR